MASAALRYPPTLPDSLLSEDAHQACTDPSQMHGHQNSHVGTRREHVTDPIYRARNFTAINTTSTSPSSLPQTTRPPQYGFEQYRPARPAGQEAFTAGAYSQGYYGGGGYHDGGYYNGRDSQYPSQYSSHNSGERYGGFYQGQGQSYAQEQYTQAAYPQRYHYAAYPQVQHPFQDTSWNYGQGSNGMCPTAPAQQAGYAYPNQWYAPAQSTPPAYAAWGTWPGPANYYTQQQLLTPAQDEDTQEGGVSLAPPSTGTNFESVNTKSLFKRMGVNKKNRSSTLNPAISKTPAGHTKRASRRQKVLENVASLMSDIPPPPSKSPRNERLYLLKRPTPTPAYLQKANQEPRLLNSPRPLLVILDLNGTLLFRKRRGGSNTFVARPHVNHLLDYLFSNHTVMVWSSARPENVAKVCADLFTPEQQAQLVAVWARDKLRLNKTAYNERVQVYKQLSWVFQDTKIRGKKAWSQADTVLIDDSIEKAASEPYNIIEMDEFEARPEQMEADVLGQVTQYLQQLQWQSDVSAFMRTRPFQHVSVTATT